MANVPLCTLDISQALPSYFVFLAIYFVVYVREQDKKARKNAQYHCKHTNVNQTDGKHGAFTCKSATKCGDQTHNQNEQEKLGKRD